MKNYKNIVLTAALLLGAGAVNASIITNLDTNADHDFFVDDFSGTDLINSGQATLLSSSGDLSFSGGGFISTSSGLNDGASSPAFQNGTGKTFYTSGLLPATHTFLLDTSVNTLGYNLLGIDTYAGWDGTDSSQVNQQYEIFVSLIGDEAFNSLAEVNYTPFTAGETDEASTIVSLTDSTGFLAMGVDAIRFVFASNPSGNGTVYQEIDVMGQAVPEPLVLSFVGLVGIGSLVIRRFHS